MIPLEYVYITLHGENRPKYSFVSNTHITVQYILLDQYFLAVMVQLQIGSQQTDCQKDRQTNLLVRVENTVR